MSEIIFDLWVQRVEPQKTLDVLFEKGYTDISLQYVKQEYARLELDYKITMGIL